MFQVMTQLSVHTENRPGALADITETLLEDDVNIVAIYAPDSSGEFGTVRVLPDKVNEAKAALARNQVFIRYAYASIMPGADSAMCILRVDDLERAREILARRFA